LTFIIRLLAFPAFKVILNNPKRRNQSQFSLAPFGIIETFHWQTTHGVTLASKVAPEYSLTTFDGAPVAEEYGLNTSRLSGM